ncbi:PhzF family phenazine biosynthesis protein [Lipingzhangella sp. LS1_29]|uniref:PhzF family phenazine biosynthesis protein n=1 Tax=Lipingzhangella rawalii TaxID=2055835 RepID=A0ABU2HB33_9ACTN|nr:PhzF family phenazine biosynthesis protein [Lipingzhangella rawalii]MDS1272534.1 PhzF family phenazine biosynthesis protein [Lipingzhangella rawalii]
MTETRSTTLHVVSVFLGENGVGGNPLGVLLDAAGLPDTTRQAIAADLGFSETVFVEDLLTGSLRIHTPETELPLAGHPLVGTSWLLNHQGLQVSTVRPPAGAVATWTDGDLTWIRANPADAPVFDTRQLTDPAGVEALDGGEPGTDLHVWAWEDEEAGRVRVRVFPTGLGVAEDEATGAAAMRLTALLERPLSIRQGAGSRIETRPGPEGTVDVGGRVRYDESRPYLISDVVPRS